MAVATGREYGLFIDGELVEASGGDVRELVEPATGDPLARAAMAGPQDVDRAVEAAQAALAGPWGKTPPNERSRLLHALADAIHANRKELAELEARNVGKAISSVKGEVHQAVENFRYFASTIASISGTHVVFRVGGAIEVLDTRTGTVRTLARVRGDVIGVSIEGKRVAWGQNVGPRRRAHGVVRALTLP